MDPVNFIFDFGNVLVDFKPVVYLSGLFSDKSLIELLNDMIFSSPEWLMMDKGSLTRDEAIDIFCAREPGYQEEIRLTMNNTNDIVSPIEETIELLPKIKENGHRLYYLSNMPIETRAFLLENHEYIKMFDGGVFSCDVNALKPSPEIYKILLDRYNLIPGECIFFDDVERNVAAAEKEGIKGVLFTTAECVLDYI